MTQTIRVGQRLIRWDQVTGYVDGNSLGVTVHGPGEEFLVLWKDGEEQYLTLEQFAHEGVRRGNGLMPWAQ